MSGSWRTGRGPTAWLRDLQQRATGKSLLLQCWGLMPLGRRLHGVLDRHAVTYVASPGPAPWTLST